MGRPYSSARGHCGRHNCAGWAKPRGGGGTNIVTVGIFYVYLDTPRFGLVATQSPLFEDPRARRDASNHDALLVLVRVARRPYFCTITVRPPLIVNRALPFLPVSQARARLDDRKLFPRCSCGTRVEASCCTRKEIMKSPGKS
jgi:hypothetical protein